MIALNQIRHNKGNCCIKSVHSSFFTGNNLPLSLHRTNFTKIYRNIYILYAKKYTRRLDVTSVLNI